MILGKEISVENIKKMLAGEKRFNPRISFCKNKTSFDAYLTLDKNGKIKFDFPPRVASAKNFC